jgi:hypothetical protein
MTTPVSHISPKGGVQQLRSSGIYVYKARGQRPDYFKFNFCILYPPTDKVSQFYLLFTDAYDIRNFIYTHNL